MLNIVINDTMCKFSLQPRNKKKSISHQKNLYGQIVFLVFFDYFRTLTSRQKISSCENKASSMRKQNKTIFTRPNIPSESEMSVQRTMPSPPRVFGSAPAKHRAMSKPLTKYERKLGPTGRKLRSGRIARTILIPRR